MHEVDHKKINPASEDPRWPLLLVVGRWVWRDKLSRWSLLTFRGRRPSDLRIGPSTCCPRFGHPNARFFVQFALKTGSMLDCNDARDRTTSGEETLQNNVRGRNTSEQRQAKKHFASNQLNYFSPYSPTKVHVD